VTHLRCNNYYYYLPYVSSEPPSVEDDVDVWRYAVLELHARNNDDMLVWHGTKFAGFFSVRHRREILHDGTYQSRKVSPVGGDAPKGIPQIRNCWL